MLILTPAAAAAIQNRNCPLAVLIEMDLSSPLFLNTGGINLSYGGSTYYGAKGLGTIDTIKDTASEIANLKFQLAGVSQSLIALALGEPVQGKSVRIKLAIFDPVTYQILDVSMRWAGRLDVMNLTTGAGQGTITVSAEHAGIDLVRPGNSLYTNAEQQMLHPGDLAFQYLDEQIDQKIVWPAATWGRQ
jgi:hypothetical protein